MKKDQIGLRELGLFKRFMLQVGISRVLGDRYAAVWSGLVRDLMNSGSGLVIISRQGSCIPELVYDPYSGGVWWLREVRNGVMWFLGGVNGEVEEISENGLIFGYGRSGVRVETMKLDLGGLGHE